MDCTQVFCESDNDKSLEYTENEKVGYLEVKGAQYPVYSGKNRIGRDPEFCTIIFNNMTLSKEHAIIEAKNHENHLIYDLASKNRTRLGKMYLEPHVRYYLQDKALLQFGDLLAVYHQFTLRSERLSEVRVVDETLEDVIVDTPAPQRSKLVMPMCNKLVAENIFEAETQCGCFMKNCGCNDEGNEISDGNITGDFNENTEKTVSNEYHSHQITSFSPEALRNKEGEGNKRRTGLQGQNAAGTGRISCQAGEAFKHDSSDFRATDEDSDATDAEDMFSESVSQTTRERTRQGSAADHSISPSTLDIDCQSVEGEAPCTDSVGGATVEYEEKWGDSNIPGRLVRHSAVDTVQQKDDVLGSHAIPELSGNTTTLGTVEKKEDALYVNSIGNSSVETVELNHTTSPMIRSSPSIVETVQQEDALNHDDRVESPGSPSIIETAEQEDALNHNNISVNPNSTSIVKTVEQKLDILEHNNILRSPGSLSVVETVDLNETQDIVESKEKSEERVSQSIELKNESTHSEINQATGSSLREKTQNESNGCDSLHENPSKGIDHDGPTQKPAESKASTSCGEQSHVSVEKATPAERQVRWGGAELRGLSNTSGFNTSRSSSSYDAIHEAPTQVIGEESKFVGKGRMCRSEDGKPNCSLLSNSSTYSSIHEAPTQEMGADNMGMNGRPQDINATLDNIPSSGSYEYGSIHDASTLPLVEEEEPTVRGNADRKRSERAQEDRGQVVVTKCDSGDETDPEDSFVQLTPNIQQQRPIKTTSNADVDISLAPTQLLSAGMTDKSIEVIYDLPTQVVDGRTFESEGHKTEFEMADIHSIPTQVLNEVTPKKARSAPQVMEIYRGSSPRRKELPQCIFYKKNQVLETHAHRRQEKSNVPEKSATGSHINSSTSSETIYDMATQIFKDDTHTENITSLRGRETSGNTAGGMCTSTPLYPREKRKSEEERPEREIELILPNTEELLAAQRAILDEGDKDDDDLEYTAATGSPAIQRHNRYREKSAKQDEGAADTALEVGENPSGRPVRNRKQTWKVRENLNEDNTSDECRKRAKIETKTSRERSPKERKGYHSRDDGELVNDKNNCLSINREDSEVGNCQPITTGKKANTNKCLETDRPKANPQMHRPSGGNCSITEMSGPSRDRKDSSKSISTYETDLAKDKNDFIYPLGDTDAGNTYSSRSGKRVAANKKLTVPTKNTKPRTSSSSDDDYVSKMPKLPKIKKGRNTFYSTDETDLTRCDKRNVRFSIEGTDTSNRCVSMSVKRVIVNKPTNSGKVKVIPTLKIKPRPPTSSSDDDSISGASRSSKKNKKGNKVDLASNENDAVVTRRGNGNTRPSRSRRKAVPSSDDGPAVKTSKKTRPLPSTSDDDSSSGALLQDTTVCARETIRRVVSRAKNLTGELKKPEVVASPLVQKAQTKRKRKDPDESENKSNKSSHNEMLLQKGQSRETSNGSTPTQKTLTSKTKSEIQKSVENIRTPTQGKNRYTSNRKADEKSTERGQVQGHTKTSKAVSRVQRKAAETCIEVTENVKECIVLNEIKEERNQNYGKLNSISTSSSSTDSTTATSSELSNVIVAPPPSPDLEITKNKNIRDKRIKSGRLVEKKSACLNITAEHLSSDLLTVNTSSHTTRNEQHNTSNAKHSSRRQQTNSAKIHSSGHESGTYHNEVLSDLNLAEKKPGLLDITSTSMQQSSRKNTSRKGRGSAALQKRQSSSSSRMTEVGHKEDAEEEFTSRLKRRKVFSSPSRQSASTRDNQTSQAEGTPKRSSRLTLKATYHIMFTGIICTELDKAVVKKLGGLVVEKPELCSVLVTDKVRRTVKFLYTMGQGKPIVSLDWIRSSEEAGYFLDPWNYLVNDKESEDKFGFKIKKSLKAALQNKMLEGYSIYVTPKVKPIPLEMKGIVESCGGMYLSRIPSSTWPVNSFVISCPEDKTLWNKLKKIPLVTAEAILTGVLRQKLDLKIYSLK